MKLLKATEGTGKEMIKLGITPSSSFHSFYVILIIFTWACLETQPWSHAEIDVLVQLSQRKTANIWNEKEREAMEEVNGQKVLTPIV